MQTPRAAQLSGFSYPGADRGTKAHQERKLEPQLAVFVILTEKKVLLTLLRIFCVFHSHEDVNFFLDLVLNLFLRNLKLYYYSLPLIKTQPQYQ